MNDYMSTYIYNDLGEKIGDSLSPIYFEEDFGYVREISATDNLSAEDEKCKFGYFDSTGGIIFAAETKELIYSEASAMRWLVFLPN